MKNLFIFDCFGVICSEIAPVWFARHFEEAEARRLKELYFAGADRGDTDLDALVEKLSAGLGIPQEQIRREWGESFSLNTPLLDFIRALRGNHHVALLSNAPRGLVEQIFGHFGLYELFDQVFISSHYGMVKPEREFYRLCTNAFTGEYDRAFMIDDNKANLQGLEELGITPVYFTGNRTFFETMEEVLP